VVKTELDDAPTPVFAPGDYLDEAELEWLLPKLGEEAGLAPGDFVDERHLDTDIGLVSQTTAAKRTRRRSGGWSWRSRGRSSSTSSMPTSEEAADVPPPWHKAPVSIPEQNFGSRLPWRRKLA
jgi:hypothetical protein